MGALLFDRYIHKTMNKIRTRNTKRNSPGNTLCQNTFWLARVLSLPKGRAEERVSCGRRPFFALFFLFSTSPLEKCDSGYILVSLWSLCCTILEHFKRKHSATFDSPMKTATNNKWIDLSFIWSSSFTGLRYRGRFLAESRYACGPSF